MYAKPTSLFRYSSIKIRRCYLLLIAQSTKDSSIKVEENDKNHPGVLSHSTGGCFSQIELKKNLRFLVCTQNIKEKKWTRKARIRTRRRRGFRLRRRSRPRCLSFSSDEKRSATWVRALLLAFFYILILKRFLLYFIFSMACALLVRISSGRRAVHRVRFLRLVFFLFLINEYPRRDIKSNTQHFCALRAVIINNRFVCA